MSSMGLSEKIAAFIREKAATKIDDLEKKVKKVKEGEQTTGVSEDSEAVFREKLQTKQEQFKPVNWLTAAARRAGQMQGVTHVLKFTNTSAEGTSLYASPGESDPTGVQKGGVVSTATLTNLDLDFVGNAASLDVVKLLLLHDGGKALADYIKEGDMSPLAPFAVDEIQLKEWREGFMKVWMSKELASHTYSKQIYFPVGKGQYHLLSPLHASSFAHAVYKEVKESRFSDQAKLSRQAWRESKYSSVPVVDYRNTAIQAYGGTKPQNVSQLNSVRGGKMFLLSCAPPLWEEQTKPPLNTKTIFSQRHFEKRVWKEVTELREYLRKQHNQKSVKRVRDFRRDRIEDLIDQLIKYGTEIRSLQDISGWSALPECKLSRAEQLWLDPRRSNDEQFALEYEKGDWKEQIADLFAHWLNRRLKTKELHFGDVEHREWKSLLEQVLRLIKDDLEVFSEWTR